MAVKKKVGILATAPSPGVAVVVPPVENYTFDLLTKEADFLDDPRFYPQPQWYTENPIPHILSSDWEEYATAYRTWRDMYTRELTDYWGSRLNLTPIQPTKYTIYTTGRFSSAESIKAVSPGPNYTFNYPVPNPIGGEYYPVLNTGYPLKVNKLKISMPLVQFQDLYFNDLDMIEDQSQVRDNQSAIDSKQAEINAVLAIISPIENSMTLVIESKDIANVELQELINTGADQSLIDAKQSEYDALQAQFNSYLAQIDQICLDYNFAQLQTELTELQNASQWVNPDTLYNRMSNYVTQRDRWKFLMNESVYRELTTEEQIELETTANEGRVNMWTGDIFVSKWSDSRFSYLYPNGIMPADILPGVTDITVIQCPSNGILPSTGNPGEVINNPNSGWYAWDPQNQEWSMSFYDNYIDPNDVDRRAVRDSKIKGNSNLILDLKPVIQSSFYIPGFIATVNSDYETIKTF